MPKALQAICEGLGLETGGLIALLIFTMVVSSVMGWMYEMLFYRIDSGGKWVKRGHGIGPWLPIYGFGGLFMLLACWGMRDNPLLVLVTSGTLAFVLEFATGYVLYHCFDGLRLWDYNVEIWNWGNIGGYVCLRSILLFAFAGLVLVSWVVPLIAQVIQLMGEQTALIAAAIVGIIYTADIIQGYLIKGL